VVAAWEFEAVKTNGFIETPNGTPVASGGGYAAGEADGNSPAAGQSYAYATGPVRVFLAEMTTASARESLDRSDNTLTFRAERVALAYWDTALQVAVLIDWTP
jgi:hypothetical protein